MPNLCGLTFESFVDAIGVSCVLFISGCNHNCPGCHSPQTHSFDSGEPLDDSLIENINKEIDKRPYLNALVLSGGDPMYSAKDLISIIEKLHIPKNNLWCYSGFTIEEIQADPDMAALLEKCTYLVDGPFIQEQRDVSLHFRGSSNQRVWQKKNNQWQLSEVMLYDL